MLTVLVANLTLASAMFGVIWVIQLVHYPLFAGLDESTLGEWHKFHTRRITYLVAPLMVGELALSIGYAWMAASLAGFVALVLTVGVWIATFTWSVPLHESLAQIESDSGANLREIIRRLVLTNWARSLLYTLKAILLIVLFLRL